MNNKIVINISLPLELVTKIEKKREHDTRSMIYEKLLQKGLEFYNSNCKKPTQEARN